MTGIDAVRLKAADQSTITREEGKGNATNKYWKLGHSNILASPALEVRINDVVTILYTADLVNGIVTFTTAPAMNDKIEFIYYWSQFSDTEIQFFIDESGGDTTIAAAKVLLAIAASASKVAERQSLAGGGGLGSVTIDTSVTARELRNTAAAMIDSQIQLNNVTPAEGLTEVAWTEAGFRESLTQRVIREN